MKIRTARYIIREGISNTYRNKLITFASICVIVASLFVLGIFYSIIINFNVNARALDRQPVLSVICNPNDDSDMLNAIEAAISKDPRVQDYKRVTKEEGFSKLEDLLGNYKDALDGLGSDFLPVKINVHLNDPSQSKEAAKTFEKIPGVEKVDFSQMVIDIIVKLTNIVRIVSIVLMLLLLGVSVFIISNTIRITVFARRREINIMKYVGATDSFIRWPFLVEGVIIGGVSAIVAFILLSYSYNALEGRFSADLAYMSHSLFTLMKLRDLGLQVLGIFAAVGIVVGILGSVISIRRYLRV